METNGLPVLNLSWLCGAGKQLLSTSGSLLCSQLGFSPSSASVWVTLMPFQTRSSDLGASPRHPSHRMWPLSFAGSLTPRDHPVSTLSSQPGSPLPSVCSQDGVSLGHTALAPAGHWRFAGLALQPRPLPGNPAHVSQSLLPSTTSQQVPARVGLI